MFEKKSNDDRKCLIWQLKLDPDVLEQLLKDSYIILMNWQMFLQELGSNLPQDVHLVKSRYLGADVPAEDLIWQDPIPAVDYTLSESEIADLKQTLY